MLIRRRYKLTTIRIQGIVSNGIIGYLINQSIYCEKLAEEDSFSWCLQSNLSFYLVCKGPSSSLSQPVSST